MAKVETDLDIARRIDDEAESFMPTMAMMLMGCSHSAKLVVATKLSATLIALAVQGKREDVDGLISMFEVGLRREIDRQWDAVQEAPAIVEMIKREMSGATTN